ncbi:type VII secretion protein EssA [Neobacillus jeddahensis]|uniref:type VII secretion protein EssA n=1 Tax=Neobacillus jeddahensis TaxID=1461580 RepID=UPI00058E88B5|nr:type VII secretion protein EssA [Neobacillus jeddahensis]
MKELVKLFSSVVFIAGIHTLFSLHPLADTNLDHSGKIRVQSERIGQDAIERKSLETQDYKETELEKIAPDLFKEQTRAAIEAKQGEMERSTEVVEQELFTIPRAPNLTIQNTEKVLFSSDYTVQYTAAPTQKTTETNNDDLLDSKTLTAFFGMVVLGCGGIFTMMRKMLA